jgi:purine-binding chemotaxis protein CheW
MSPTRQYATFRIAGLRLGLEVVQVREVLRYQEMTVIPLAASAVRGLINLRGQIVTAIDTRCCLGLPRTPDTVPPMNLPMNLVIQSEEGAVSLLVDEIGDVIDVPAAALAPVPDHLPPEQKELIPCVYDLPEGLMLVLDPHRLLQRVGQQMD